ncbi:Hemerythrin-like metal-binding protein [Candidatus Sulfopaludibacter sp. SbA4]|nr:Hemerythrin-like metal-binding protein [Candidatus Sulfopaludibacter sp. SbA4]
MLLEWTMRSLKWSTSHAVFVTEIDDEHKEIFEALVSLQKLLSSRGLSLEIRKQTQRLTACIEAHFAHEERLMRAARYGSLRWHKQQHDNARKRVGQFVLRMEQGETKAGPELLDYLTSWLRYHTRLADRMMGAFLRNQRRGMCKLTFRAGTKPMDACAWVDSNGDTFDPQTNEYGF